MMDEYDPLVQMQAIHKQVGGWFEAFLRILPNGLHLVTRSGKER